MNRHIALALLLAVLAISLQPALACTRLVYTGEDGLVISARSMDWKDEIPATLWVFPRGMNRDGATGSNTVKWTSRYGSVVISSLDIATSDGVNEKGLYGNTNWLTPSVYPNVDNKRPTLSLAAWLQYILDNFATVAEAVNALKYEPFDVVTAPIPGTDRPGAMHVSLSDPSGDSAVFEYVNGKLVIHHDPSYKVMTNDPIFEEQLAIKKYWEQIGGATMLPGTNRAADRFVRASFYVDAIPKTSDARIAVASVFSVIRNCSVPYGISTPNQPHIASTRWRTVTDHKNLVYYFENVLTPNVFWVDLKKLNFREGAPVLCLTTANNETYSGEVSALFKPCKPFQFAGI